MSKQKVCVSFAGPVGSSKTPIAFYLSLKFGLPMINNDVIRIEVAEDLLEFNQQEFEKRRNFRTEELLKTGNSFIFDASIDRSWDVFHQYLNNYGYKWFLISMDISKDHLKRIHAAKEYKNEAALMDKYYADHQNFLDHHSDEISIHITDENFPTRLELVYENLKSYLTDSN